MTPLDAARRYAERGWPVLPCHPSGPQHKRPVTQHGLHDATAILSGVSTWWTRWPDALIGVPTGLAIGAVVLDIDIKHPKQNGYDTLEDLGYAILPETPMVHTASGGLHLYFKRPSEG